MGVYFLYNFHSSCGFQPPLLFPFSEVPFQCHYFLNFSGSLQGNHCPSGFSLLLLRFSSFQVCHESPHSPICVTRLAGFCACLLCHYEFCLFEIFLYLHFVGIFKENRSQLMCVGNLTSLNWKFLLSFLHFSKKEIRCFRDLVYFLVLYLERQVMGGM